MIVSTALPLPDITPDDWDKWWSIWNRFSMPLKKTGYSPNNIDGYHTGFDIFKRKTFNPVYEAPVIDLENLYPEIYEKILSMPVELSCVRFVRSNDSFLPHMDNFVKSWQIRNMFYCEDPEPQWYYTDVKNENVKFLYLPESTKWWAYMDGAIKHSTIYRPNYPKIIVQIFCNINSARKYVEENLNTFPEYNIEYDYSTGIHTRLV